MFFISLFFFNDPATTEIYTLSLHDALPIYSAIRQRVKRIAPTLLREKRSEYCCGRSRFLGDAHLAAARVGRGTDRKSTRLNSSHVEISYAVFCLKKKKKKSNSYDAG